MLEKYFLSLLGTLSILTELQSFDKLFLETANNSNNSYLKILLFLLVLSIFDMNPRNWGVQYYETEGIILNRDFLHFSGL